MTAILLAITAWFTSHVTVFPEECNTVRKGELQITVCTSGVVVNLEAPNAPR